MPTPEEECEARVLAGAEWLDSKRADWAPDIDCSRLDTYNGYNCIMGQLAQKSPVKTGKSHRPIGYLDGIRLLNLPADKAQALGFYPVNVGIRAEAEKECRLLDRFWIVQIKKRLV